MVPDTVNWHITYGCNYRCSFCFFRDIEGNGGTIPRLKFDLDDAARLISMLRDSGVKRINYAGGEPTLVREFPQLVTITRTNGMVPTVVTNGTGITESLLDIIPGIGAIKLSVDSAKESVEKQLGRGYGIHVRNILVVANRIRSRNITLMANTVVTALNYREDMHSIISLLRPKRWKVFQVLPIEGQNLYEYQKLGITREEFDQFTNRHADVPEMVPEDNDLMTQSYAMIDPLGRFFQNTGSIYRFSDNIMEVGVDEAFSQLEFSRSKYYQREIGGPLLSR